MLWSQNFLVPLIKEGYKIEGIDFFQGGMLKEAAKFAKRKSEDKNNTRKRYKN